MISESKIYQYFSDCLAECKRLQRVMVAMFSGSV